MSVPPPLLVVADDPTPPYEQLRRQVDELIGSGVLAPGQRLPPLRQLAGDLGPAVGTVARTYRELEAAGLVISRRGGGARVAAAAPAMSFDRWQSLLRAQAEAYVRQARLLGADGGQVLSAVEAGLRTS